jgi:hypothetical protein
MRHIIRGLLISLAGPQWISGSSGYRGNVILGNRNTAATRPPHDLPRQQLAGDINANSISITW